MNPVCEILHHHLCLHPEYSQKNVRNSFFVKQTNNWQRCCYLAARWLKNSTWLWNKKVSHIPTEDWFVLLCHLVVQTGRAASVTPLSAGLFLGISGGVSAGLLQDKAVDRSAVPHRANTDWQAISHTHACTCWQVFSCSSWPTCLWTEAGKRGENMWCPQKRSHQRIKLVLLLLMDSFHHWVTRFPQSTAV